MKRLLPCCVMLFLTVISLQGCTGSRQGRAVAMHAPELRGEADAELAHFWLVVTTSQMPTADMASSKLAVRIPEPPRGFYEKTPTIPLDRGGTVCFRFDVAGTHLRRSDLRRLRVEVLDLKDRWQPSQMWILSQDEIGVQYLERGFRWPEKLWFARCGKNDPKVGGSLIAASWPVFEVGHEDDSTPIGHGSRAIPLHKLDLKEWPKEEVACPSN